MELEVDDIDVLVELEVLVDVLEVEVELEVLELVEVVVAPEGE